jgi:riboflavin synthase
LFAGIIEALGTVVRVAPAPRNGSSATQAQRLEIDGQGLFAELRPGASVAVNGACLTLTAARQAIGCFDVIPETWHNTALRLLHAGDAVNLERSLRIGDRLDGHFVQGHVDGVGAVQRLERTGGEWKLWISAPPELLPYIVRKGSIALDGVSLTIVDVSGDAFSVALIPVTLERTVLGRRRPGDVVNVETDILARLVLSRLEALRGAEPSSEKGITLEALRERGFV